MGTALLPPFVESYARLAHEYRLPVLAVRPDPEALVELGAEGAAELYRQVLDGIEADGIPILDGFDVDSLRFEPGESKEVTLTEFGGTGELHGLNGLTEGSARSEARKEAALRRARDAGFKGA